MKKKTIKRQLWLPPTQICAVLAELDAGVCFGQSPCIEFGLYSIEISPEKWYRAWQGSNSRICHILGPSFWIILHYIRALASSTIAFAENFLQFCTISISTWMCDHTATVNWTHMIDFDFSAVVHPICGQTSAEVKSYTYAKPLPWVTIHINYQLIENSIFNLT